MTVQAHPENGKARNAPRMTNVDKRTVVEGMIADPEWSQWSNSAIARACGVDKEFVRRTRKEIEEGQANKPRTVQKAAASNSGLKEEVERRSYGSIYLRQGEIHVVDVDKDFASRLIKANTKDAQRGIKRETLKRYIQDLNDNDWVWTGNGLVFTPEMVLIDGQHRLTAFLQNKGTDTLQEMPVFVAYHQDAYEYMDQAQPRNIRDIARQICASRGIDTPPDTAIAACLYEKVDFKRRHLSQKARPRKVAEALGHPYLDDVSRLYRVRIPATGRHPSAPILAAAARCMRVDREDAFEFFRASIENDTVHGRDEPHARVLSQLLMRPISRCTVEANIVSAKSMRAFVNYRKGAKSRKLVWHGNDMPIDPQGRIR